MLPWLICGALALAALVLLARLLLLRRSLDEMVRQLEERLSQDTNSPIFLPTRDAHARKLASELNLHLKDLRRQQQKFQQGDAELKAAVTNISHDLRTPLTAMQGYLDLLEREELFRYSLAAGRQELLPEEVDLRRCLEESLVSFYAAMGRRGIAPDISLPQGPVVRTLDPSAVGRIFGNIISNALKYSDGDFSASLDESGTAVFSNAARALDPVSAARLFDRFYTVETGRGSTGLGLSIARQLTERMGGTIRADYEQARLYITVHFPKT